MTEYWQASAAASGRLDEAVAAAWLAEVRRSPAETGTVELIVRRPAVDDREVVDVGMVISEAIHRTALAAERQDIHITVADPHPPKAMGDSRQLVSAVANLLDNAVKYSDTGSEVTVSVVGADGWVDITVADRGIGIPTRDLDRIFERFYRVDRARSRETGGTGLGLAIVRHVANNHGGVVRVQSREGEGSVFTLRIPASED